MQSRNLSHAFGARLLAALALLLFAPFALATYGQVDFIKESHIPLGNNAAMTVIQQSDGKFLTAGYARFGTIQFSITRYNSDGSLDTTFGNNGTVLEPIGSGDSTATGVAEMPNGNVVAGGYVTHVTDDFAIAQFTSTGQLYLPFGGGGARTQVGVGNARAYGLVVQGDGKIVLAGYATATSGGHSGFALVRYNTNATLDTTFGTGGIVITTIGGGDAQAHAIAIDGSGRLVVAGTANGALAVARYNTDGSLDTSFNTTGIQTIATGGLTNANAIAIQANGALVVAGAAGISGGTGFGVARLTSAGALDTTFNGSGTAAIAFAGNTAIARSIALQANGAIALAGFSLNSTGSRGAVALARLTSAGALDASFGSSGTVLQTVSPTDETANAMAMLADGRFLVVGSATHPSYDELLAMFTSAGAEDTTFNGTGYRTLDVGSAPSVAKGTVIQPADGKIVSAGYVDYEAPLSGHKMAILRYNTDGSPDTTFGVNGIALGGYHANAVALQSNGSIVATGYDGDVGSRVIQVARFTASGALDATFGSGGIVDVSVNGVDDEANAVLILSNGDIVVGGFTKNGTFLDSVFVRLTPSGALDTTFNASGKSVVAMSTGSDQVNAMALQSDGKIVGTGYAEITGGVNAFGTTRINADGTLDTSFGTNGVVTTMLGTVNTVAYGVAVQSNGAIVIGGLTFNSTSTTDDFALARYTASGALDSTFGSGGTVETALNNHNRIFALQLLGNGEIAVAGEWAGSFMAALYTTGGALDTTFGTNGVVSVPVNAMAGADHAWALAIQSDGKWVLGGDGSGLFGLVRLFGTTGGSVSSLTPTVTVASSANPSTSGQSITLTANVSGSGATPSGVVNFVDGSTSISGCGSISLANGSAACTTSSLPVGSHSVTVSYSGDSTYAAATSATLTQTVQSPPPPGSQLAISPATIDFGGESMGTTSLPQTVTVTNNGGTTITVSGIAASSQFGQTNNCSTLGAGASCTVTVTFTPSAAAGPVNSTVSVGGSLSITSNDPGSPATVTLSGTAEKSMITHYYEAILRREPDAGGKAFWQGEASNAVSMGLDVNETWYAMAMSFFASAEYAGFNRDDNGFVTDLYNTFFNRAPDSGGLSYWTGQIAQGMPREVVLVSFLFSTEFTSFSQSVFGNTAVRAEIDMVTDFYRGLLGRLPDSGGFTYWVGQFRTAQCQGASQVTAQANSISSAFMNSAEYVNRNRTNAQFVGDMYDTFLRRGGDLTGVQFWLGQLNSGAMTREQVREQFVASQEFQNRVSAVIQQGCMQ